MQIEAPALEALLTNPILHEHGPHGLIVALRSLSGFINTISNIMNHYRLASLGLIVIAELPVAGSEAQ